MTLVKILDVDGVERAVSEQELERRDTVDETDDVRVEAVEYRRLGDSRLVKRSAVIHLKRWPAQMAGQAGGFG